MEYPEFAARTRRFTHGAPRAVTVTGDGQRVVFLRSAGQMDPADALWCLDVETGIERLIADPARLREQQAAERVAELPDHERALRERLRLSAGGIGSYATDGTGTMAAFTLDGTLYRADLVSGTTTSVRTAGPVVDPRPDATGRMIAYVTDGTLRVVDADGADRVLAEEDGVTWGLAEFIAAEEFGRFRGHWWSPDGRQVLAERVDESRVPRWYLHDPASPDREQRSIAYPHAGAVNATVSLHLLDTDGGWVDVRWDTDTYPYLVSVSWSEPTGPLLTVMRRLQHHGLVLTVDPRTGETTVHAELSGQPWVERIPGTPTVLADGRVLVGGDLATGDHDARCLFADGNLVTPPELYVRSLAGRLASAAASPGGRPGPCPPGMPCTGGAPIGNDLIVEASAGEPSEQHVYRIARPSPGGPPVAQRLTSDPGWHVASAGGRTIAIGSLSLDHPGTLWRVYRDGVAIAQLASNAAIPPYAPRPLLTRVTDRGIPTGLVYPRDHVAGRPLPVLVDIYGGPGHQEVVAARSRWVERQWWADNGFAVVTVDNRGTPGVSPAFDKAIHSRLADVIMADQVDALRALADKHPDLDTARVAIRGWSFGGWLSALAVLSRPDVYHVGVAGAPVTDWALYDTAYTERYLGLPQEQPGAYRANNLVDLAEQPPAAGLPARQLLLVHGMVDDNVVAAHTLRLSGAMLRSGRPHAVVPLSGATHMAAGGIAEQLLRLELDFIRRNLPAAGQ